MLRKGQRFTAATQPVRAEQGRGWVSGALLASRLPSPPHSVPLDSWPGGSGLLCGLTVSKGTSFLGPNSRHEI